MGRAPGRAWVSRSRGDATSGGIEPERPVELDVDLAPRLDRAARWRGADQLGSAAGEREMNQALVAEDLDPPDRGTQRLPRLRGRGVDVQMLGANADRDGVARRRPVAERAAREQVDPRRAEPRGDGAGLRVLVDLARAADLRQPA